MCEGGDIFLAMDSPVFPDIYDGFIGCLRDREVRMRVWEDAVFNDDFFFEGIQFEDFEKHEKIHLQYNINW